MQQEDFASMMEQAYRSALEQADIITDNAKKIQLQALEELDAAREAHRLAEIAAEEKAEAYFEGRQIQFTEAACTKLLRDLARKHLESGKKAEEIALWLDVPLEFVVNIRQVMERVVNYYRNKSTRVQLEGNPTLRYVDQGRGGTIYFESSATTFDMWWEFAGGNALTIVEIPDTEHWVARTKLPLEKRKETLDFIGEQIIEDKIAGEGSFIVGENVITFYVGRQ